MASVHVHFRITFLVSLILVVFTSTASIPCGAQEATDEAPVEIAQPPSCGDQDLDDRPNACAVLVAGTWVLKKSQCAPLPNGDFLYTHCNGTTQIQYKTTASKGSRLCCLHDSSCPGSSYVGVCLDK